jgi:hypothetical protein
MPLIGSLTSFSGGSTAIASQVNSNFTTIRDAVNAYALFKDVSSQTVSVGVTWTQSQTFSGGFTAAAASTFSAAMTVASTAPSQIFNETDQGVDEKKWNFLADGKVFTFRSLDDAGSAGSNIFTVTRSTGTAISRLTFVAGTTFSSAPEVSMTANAGIVLNDNDQGADNKKWFLQSHNGSGGFYALSDDGSGITPAITCTRSGMTVTGVNIGSGLAVSGTASATGDLTAAGGLNSVTASVNCRFSADEGNARGAIGTLTNHPLIVVTNGAIRWTVGATGHLTPGVTNTHDIGSAGATVRDLFVGRDVTIGGTCAITGTATVTTVAGNPSFSAGLSVAAGQQLVLTTTAGMRVGTSYGLRNNDGSLLYLSAGGANLILGNGTSMDVVVSGATTTTDGIGFFRIPQMAGVPTGAAVNGSLTIDSTNNRFYVRVGGAWKYAALT